MLHNTPTHRSSLLAVLCFSIFFGTLYSQPLSGTYTIGASGSGYATFREAIYDLHRYGVDGPVIFNISAGTYLETDTIREIARASASSPITFQAADTNEVILQWHSDYSGDWNLWLFRTGFLNFKNITFRQTYDKSRNNIRLTGCHNLTFDGCSFEGNNTVLNGLLIGGTLDSNLTISNCTFKFSRQAFEVVPLHKVSRNISLTNNRFSTLNRAIKLNAVTNLTIAENSFRNVVASGYKAIELDNIHNLSVRKNTINVKEALKGCLALNLNNITTDSLQKSWIVNNVISVRADSNQFMDAVRIGSAERLMLVHNNIFLNSNEMASTPVRFMARDQDMEQCAIYNNIVANSGAGPVYQFTYLKGDGVDFDYNLLHSASGLITPIDYNLSTIIARDSSNAHSYVEDPAFSDFISLESQARELDSNALALSQITTDRLGNGRNSVVPDIGAYERLDPPVINLPEDTSYCGPITLDVNTNASWHIWSNGSNSSHITVTRSGTYWVTAFNGDGITSDTVVATIGQPVPFARFQSHDSLVIGECTNLSFSAFYPVPLVAHWTDSLGLDTVANLISVCPTSFPATFYIEVIDTISGCSGKDSMVVYQSFDSSKKTTNTSSNDPGHKTSFAQTPLPMAYPNPFSNELLVDYQGELSTEGIYLTDITGRRFSTNFSKVNENGSYTVDVSTLSSGAYILHVSTPSKTFHIPLTKFNN